MAFRPLNADTAPAGVISAINDYRGLFPGDALAPIESETLLLEKMASGSMKRSNDDNFDEIKRVISGHDVSYATPEKVAVRLTIAPDAPKKKAKAIVRRRLLDESAEEAMSDDEDLQEEEEIEDEDEEIEDEEEEEEEEEDEEVPIDEMYVDPDLPDEDPTRNTDHIRMARRQRSTTNNWALDETLIESDSKRRKSNAMDDDEDQEVELTPEEILRGAIYSLRGDSDSELLVVSAKHLQGTDEFAFMPTVALSRGVTMVCEDIERCTVSKWKKGSQECSLEETTRRLEGLKHHARQRIGAYFCSDAWDPNQFCTLLYEIYPSLKEYTAQQILEYLVLLIRAMFVPVQILVEDAKFSDGILHATCPPEIAGIQFRRPADGLLNWVFSENTPFPEQSSRPEWCNGTMAPDHHGFASLITNDRLAWAIVSVLFEPRNTQDKLHRLLETATLFAIYDARAAAKKESPSEEKDGEQPMTPGPIEEIVIEDDEFVVD